MLKPVKFVGAAVVIITAATPSIAFSETAVEEAQRLYRERCRVCHEDGSANGEYTPMSLIQAQWTRFFDRKFERKHRNVMDVVNENTPVTESIDEETLEKIRNFTIEHAADTDQPMTCG